MRDDGARFALVAFASRPSSMRPRIMRIPEDTVPIALERHWVVLGRDSDVLTVFNPPKLAREKGIE